MIFLEYVTSQMEEVIKLKFYSPLRYPGGKGKLEPFMEAIIRRLGHENGIYIEPFAGGAGIAIRLLEKNIVSEIVINDYDKRIYSFWRAMLSETDRFINSIESVPLNMSEWYRQRDICINQAHKYSFELGFATFYMNRTNRSGIIKGGAIGGKNQQGVWKLDARFNRENLISRITLIAKKKNRVHYYNKDIESFINHYIVQFDKNALVYFDPPYFDKGRQLYLNFFDYSDHERIEKLISNKVSCDWLITYDDVPEIVNIYSGRKMMRYDLNYSLSEKKKAQELIIFKNESMIPTVDELKALGCNLELR